MRKRLIVICPNCGVTFKMRRTISPRAESAYEFLAKNPETKSKALAKKLGVSIRMAQYYKARMVK